MLSTQLMILNYPHPCYKFYVVNCFENEGFFKEKKTSKKKITVHHSISLLRVSKRLS